MWRICQVPSMATFGSPAKTYSSSSLEWVSYVTCIKEPRQWLNTASRPPLMAVCALLEPLCSRCALRLCCALMWTIQFGHSPFLWLRKPISYSDRTDYISKGTVKSILRWPLGAWPWGMGRYQEDRWGSRSLQGGLAEWAQAWWKAKLVLWKYSNPVITGQG